MVAANIALDQRMNVKNNHRRYARRRSERGMILLIVVFCLLLLMTLGILMILSAGTETALSANYRSSTQAFYAALNGLEEGRGRLWPKHPNTLTPNLTSPGSTLAPGDVIYILNRPPDTDVLPTDLSAGNPYADREYQTEYLAVVDPARLQVVDSTSASPGVLGPMYEWVRINAVTEQMLNVDVNGGGLDDSVPLYYDGNNLNLTLTGKQVFEITSLAVLPDKSQRMVQYVVAPVPLNLKFPSALTFAGPVGSFSGPTAFSFHIVGIDHAGETCPTTDTGKSAIGIAVSDDYADYYDTVSSGIPLFRAANYSGYNGPTLQGWRNIVKVSPIKPLDTIADLDGDGTTDLVHTVKQGADYDLTGPLTSLPDPDYGTLLKPVVGIVHGDLSLSNVNGFGLLLVTGNLTIDSNVSWNGIILVIGQGSMTITGSGSGGKIDGAVFLAATRNPDYSLRSTLGPVNFNAGSSNSNGIYYNSCWIDQAQQSSTIYRTLSFRQIEQ